MSSPELKPSAFSADTLELLRLFEQLQVQYLVVGGQAVIYYGYPRLTGDIDFFYDNAARNADRLYEALVAFWGGDVPGVGGPEELKQDGVIIQFGRPPNRIDLMSRVDGLTFEEAWKTRLELRVLVKATPIRVNYVSLEKLIQNKEASGRPRDLEDLEYLRRAAQSRASRPGASDVEPN